MKKKACEVHGPNMTAQANVCQKVCRESMNELTTNKLGDMWEFMIYGNYSAVRDSFLGDSVKTNS